MASSVPRLGAERAAATLRSLRAQPVHNAVLGHGGEARRIMGFSVRLLVIDQSDNIYRLGVARFGQMLDTPRSHQFPQFAAQRVRSAEVVVELKQRRPTRVVRMTHSVLTFDQAGYLDADALNRQQRGRFDTWASTLMGREADWEMGRGVTDARSQFAARGGRWTPSRRLLRSLCDVALGNARVRRL